MSDNGPDISRHLRQKDILDRAERKHVQNMHGRMLQPRWRELTGDSPILAPGDCEGARQFLQKIQSAINHGGWTIDERNRIKALRRRWQKKASGEDKWFMANGNPYSNATGDAEHGRRAWEQQQWQWKKVRKPPA